MENDVVIAIRAIDDSSRNIKVILDNLNKLRASVNSIGANVRGIGGNLQGIFTALQTPLRMVFSTLSMIGTKLLWIAGIAGGALTAGITAAGYRALSLAGDLEQAKIAFTTMLGGSGSAQALINQLRQFANATPFEFADLVASTQKLLAFGFQGRDILPMMTAIGDAASALGGSSEVIERITIALGQIRAKGRVMAEEMLQLTEAGIPAWEMLAQRIGVSIPQAMKMAEQGAIRADIAISALIGGMEKRFPGMMAQQSQTLKGLFSTLKDSIDTMLAKIGAAMAPTFQKLIRGATEFVNRIASQENIAKFTAFWEKVFSEDNLKKGITWLANLYAWFVAIFDWIGQSAGKGIKFIQDSFAALARFLKNDFLNVMAKVAKAFIVLEAAKAGLSIMTASATLSASIAALGPQAAPFAAAILGGGLITGGLVAGIGGGLGAGLVDGLTKALKNMGLNMGNAGIPAFPKFGDLANPDIAGMVNGILGAMDNTAGPASPVMGALGQIAGNTGALVNQNRRLIDNIFGAGERTRSLAARYNFGGYPQRLQVSVNLNGGTPSEQRAALAGMEAIVSALSRGNNIKGTRRVGSTA